MLSCTLYGCGRPQFLSLERSQPTKLLSANCDLRPDVRRCQAYDTPQVVHSLCCRPHCHTASHIATRTPPLLLPPSPSHRLSYCPRSRCPSCCHPLTALAAAIFTTPRSLPSSHNALAAAARRRPISRRMCRKLRIKGLGLEHKGSNMHKTRLRHGTIPPPQHQPTQPQQHQPLRHPPQQHQPLWHPPA